MRRQPILTSFLRGARLGAAIALATLVVSATGAIMVLVGGDAEGDTVRVASDARTIPGTGHERTQRTPFQIDPGLLRAAELARPVPVGELFFQLSRQAIAAAETATPAPAAPPKAARADRGPILPPHIVPGDQLFAAIEAAFPEQPEFAYAVVMCESAGNATVNSGNGYYGLWQFDLPTWRSVGGTGVPSSASVEEQVMRARLLYDARGWQPWGCAR